MSIPDKKRNMMKAFCPECHSAIRFYERPEIFDSVTCPDCEEEFEVIGLSPIQLDWPSEFDVHGEWLAVTYDKGSLERKGRRFANWNLES